MIVLWISVILGWAGIFLFSLWVLWILRQEFRSDRIVSLLYHRIVSRELYDELTGSERIFSLPVDSFREQLQWLKDQGYGFVSLDQIVAHLRNGEALPEKPVFINFDDGCESVYSVALPILKELGVPSTVFVTTDEKSWIFHEPDKYVERRMSEDEILACEEGGIAVESHAVSHRSLPEMTREDAMKEMVDSRELLSQWVGREVRYLSIPCNFYDRTTLRLIEEAGYDGACVCGGATSNSSTSPFHIRRFIVEGTWNLKNFARSMEPSVISQRRLIAYLKGLPPKILGEGRWMPLRKRIFDSKLGPWLSFQHLRKLLVFGSVAIFCGLCSLTAFAVWMS